MTMPRSLITRAVFDERRQQSEQSLLPQAGGGSGSDVHASKRKPKHKRSALCATLRHTLTTYGLQHPADMSAHAQEGEAQQFQVQDTLDKRTR